MKKYLLLILPLIAISLIQQDKVHAKAEEQSWNLDDEEESKEKVGWSYIKKQLIKVAVAWLKPINLMLSIIFFGLIHHGWSEHSCSVPIKYIARGLLGIQGKPEMELDYVKYTPPKNTNTNNTQNQNDDTDTDNNNNRNSRRRVNNTSVLED